MFTASKSLEESAIAVAIQMLDEGKEIAPIKTPSGGAMLHVSTDMARLRGAFMQLEVKGTVVYVGLLA
jgi:hypothetical protein